LENTFEEISPKLSGKYRINDAMMAYATVAKGFKGGGYYPHAPVGSQSYESETLWNYEIGLKSQFLDKRLLLNTAVYFMDISDKQVLTSIDALNGYVSNAASATSMGAEIDLTYKVTREISIFGSLGFNKSEFEDFSEGTFDTSGNQTGTVSYDGNCLPYAPEYNYSIGVKYRNRYGWFARADVGGYGKMYLDKTNSYAQDAYDLVNAKMGYEADWYDVYVYADNLFDKEYDAVGYYSGYYTLVSAPREIGVQVNLRF
jgi:iron complex outermembrane receptor protein